MSVPRRCLLAAALGLGIVPGVQADEPGRLDVDRSRPASAPAAVSSNQKTANLIVENLRQSGPLQGCNISVVVREGTAEVTGVVPDQPRREEALRIVQGVPGVERVRDHLTLGAGRSQAVPAQAVGAAPAVSSNQKTANLIVENLRQSSPLQGSNIEVVVRGGTAELTGAVVDQPRREEALRIAQGVPGVERVRDLLVVVGPVQAQVVPAQAAIPAPGPGAVPGPGPGPVPGPVPMPRLTGPEGPPLPNPAAVPPPGMMSPYAPNEPMAIGGGGPMSPYGMTNPAMPPYAWPTYVPYNNYSRVAYPQGYPCNAWPFIGPMYPFPKIPLGWRSVKLEWQDGHWYMGQTATLHDYWRVRYW